MHSSVLLELHRAAGARLSAAPERALTFGDVPGEYRAARAGCALFDATDRGLVLVRGADAGVFLHRLLANDVRNLGVGEARRNLLLSSKGKVLHDFEVARADDAFHVSTIPGDARPLLAALDVYLFSEKVSFEDQTARHAPLELTGPSADRIVRAVLAGEPPASAGAFAVLQFESAAVVATRLPVAGSMGWRLDAGPEHVARLWTALIRAGARPAGLVARDSLRVEAARAEPGVDVDPNVYPQEARLEDAFSLEKGCYIGQEVVAKIDTYGGLNKRLVALRVAHDDPVARGTRLVRLDDGEWRDLGVVTSWAYSFVLDAGLVLAYVKRRHQKVGTEFRLGDGPATAAIVPIPVRPDALAVSGEFE